LIKTTTLSVTTILILTTFSGCGAAPQLTPEMKKEVGHFDSVAQLNELSQNIHKGMNQDELLFYAPVSIEKAKEALENAREDQLKDEKMVDYLQGKKALENAYETKKLVQKYLNDVADIDKRMKQQGTQDIFPDRYEDFKEDYKDLIITIDEGKTSEALEDKNEVMEEAKDLYGDAVVYRNINKARQILDKMDDEDLDDLAPQHYKIAEDVYEKARMQIKKEPDNLALIERVSKEANEAALYAQTLAQDVFNFRGLSKDEQEAYFAKLHKKLSKLNPKEDENAILPLPIYEKIDYLQDFCH